MKRPLDNSTTDIHHPAIAFHREVLLVQEWSSIRRDFLKSLQNVPPVVVWKEPKKLWRHSQEALGKWILSQVARVESAFVDSLFFFPTEGMFAAFDGGCSYDLQLIRDLTLKSNGAHEPKAVQAIVSVVQGFGLRERCVAAAATVASKMEAITPSNTFLPRIRCIEAGDSFRTASQQRIKGPLAEVSVVSPTDCPSHAAVRIPSVSLPWAAYLKLQMCYRHFASDDEFRQYPDVPEKQRMLLRAAVVALRYEGCLATGSLQLCADTFLKRHLHASGYHVMDLCASPINAYMGTALRGVFGSQDKTSSSLDSEHEEPNMFCSAFWDTDRYFGSLGSALRVDPTELYTSSRINPDKRPLLLTLDVPYDEDLCEMLFLKLARDMEKAETAEAKASVDYVLVLPLWWRVQLSVRKQLFTEAKDEPTDDCRVFLDRLLEERTSVFKEGYVVQYSWPEVLAKAAGNAMTSTSRQWACFDGVFVGGDYAYFCTTTNQWLHGVTTTEVIGLAGPREEADSEPKLAIALTEFFR